LSHTRRQAARDADLLAARVRLDALERNAHLIGRTDLAAVLLVRGGHS